MMRSLITRTLYERRWFVVGWSMVFAVVTALVVMFYPSFSESNAIEQLSKTIPQQLQGVIGDPDQYRTLEGFIASQIYDIRMPILIMIMGLMLALGLTVKEEESGELRSLSMLSISRTRILFEKWIAALLIITILNLVAVVGTYVGVIALGEAIPHELIWRLMILSTVFGAVAFTIPFAIGLLSGRRAPTMFVGLVITVGSFLLTTFAKAVDWLRDWERLSLVHYYDTAIVVDKRFEATDLWILLAITTISLSVAILAFRKRDIA